MSALHNTKQSITEIRTHLMNGVSHMIPVVVTGGVLYAIATMLSMNSVATSGAVEASNIVIDVLTQIGGVGLGLMVPVLAAYIASSIADRPGIAPGLICGQLAVNVGSGFIGGIIAGLLCGVLARELKKLKLPKSMQSLKSIMIIPIATSLIIGTLMICVIGTPCAWLLKNLQEWLVSLNGANAIIVGAITGAMIAVDLGGPINKVAYSTGVAVVGTEVLAGNNVEFFGPIALAICLPPIGAGIASLLFKKKFSPEEHEAGLSAIVMGACGISEGAISYTTADPIHMMPINIVSCAATGALAGGLGVWCNAAWGGLVVLPVTSIASYLISLAAGIALYLALILLFKKDYSEASKPTDTTDDLDIKIEF
ncbi:PTS fructose transporter subunit IIC [Collinsella sp. zg1085]|uniref:PTS fructose transporter subunit IIC n=1 Tax=Collinsella sp. zg1085 TaxID=2844380 RepID=UPI001C0E42B6|nr:PTS fructose transporter subunit IIC [Collinsella sp. zg1085]QWT18012.1 PTS fructose transporter subunit IIC [Collinsella sp. zg1085]